MSDPINPDHYKWLPVEVIEIAEHLGYCMGNVVKYVLRADHKGKPLEDLRKAAWYLDREIARREAEADAATELTRELAQWERADRLEAFHTPDHARYDSEQHIRGEE